MERMVVHKNVRSFITTDLYMTWEDWFFVVDVMIIDLMREMVALSVISQLVG